MGDANQLQYFSRYFDRFEPPFLEVGARDYGSTQDLRSRLSARGSYLGVDLQPGPGVDLALDMAAPFDEIEHRLAGTRFGTIFCLSVLEHCEQPFRMAENLSRLLRPGGHVCISVPFAWKYHGYPADYWRFTHHGVKRLFSSLEFNDGVAATSRPGEFLPLDDEIGKIPFTFGGHRQQNKPLRGAVAKTLAAMARLGPLRWLAGYRYVLAPTNILMIGVSKP